MMQEYGTRLDEEDLKRLDRILKKLAKETGGAEIKRATFVRSLIVKGIDQWEKKLGIVKG